MYVRSAKNSYLVEEVTNESTLKVLECGSQCRDLSMHMQVQVQRQVYEYSMGS